MADGRAVWPAARPAVRPSSQPSAALIAATAIIAAAAALLAHFPALHGAWVWDDLLVVGEQLRAFRSPRDIFFPPAGIPHFSVHYYRPLTTASYVLDRLVFGDHPWGFHLTLMLAHALAAALVFLVARTFVGKGRGDLPAALLAAVLFAVHPAHSESVGWITARADVLAACAVLGSALLLRRRPLGWTAIAAAASLFGIGCLFKEVAYAFLPLVPLYAGGAAAEAVTESPRRSSSRPASLPASRRSGVPTSGRSPAPRGSLPGATPRTDSSLTSTSGRSKRSSRAGDRSWLALAVFVATACALLALRRAALGGGLGAETPRRPSLAGALESLGGALAFYLPRVLVPLAPQPFAAAIPRGLPAWIGLAAGAALAGAAIFLIARPRWRAAGTGLASFLVLLLPSLAPAILRISIVPLAERYLYLPAAMGAIGIAGVLSTTGILVAIRPPRKDGDPPLAAVGHSTAVPKPPSARGSDAPVGPGDSPPASRSWPRSVVMGSAGLALVMWLGATSIARTRIWSDEVSLWSAAAAASDAADPRIYLATALEGRGDHARAEVIYRRLLEDPALTGAQRALVTMNLGVVLRATARPLEARGAFEAAVQANPAEPLGWYNLASQLWDLALIDPARGSADRITIERALEAARRAALLSPLDPNLLLLQGRIAGALGKKAEAREALGRALRADPSGEAGRQAASLLAHLQ